VRPPLAANFRDHAPADRQVSGDGQPEREWLTWIAGRGGETLLLGELSLGARVWLPREGRCGRVVVRVLDGLLYRVRLDDEPGRLREYSACELEPLD
jgi:hypothetical protein